MRSISWAVWVFFAFLLVSCGTPEEKKMAFFEKGKAFYEAGDYVKANLELKNALQIDPKFVQARYLLGNVALKRKEGKAAFRHFNTAIKLDPDLIEVRLDLGKLLFAGGAWDRSMEQVSEILQREPGNIDALFLKTSILLIQKKFEEVSPILEAMKDSGKEKVEYYMLLASYETLTGNYGAIEGILLEGMRAHPDSLKLALALTRYYGKKGDLSQVEEYLTRAISISPDTLKLRFSLAWLHLKNKNPEKAILILNRILTAHPEEDNHRVGAAVLLLKGGQQEAGIEMLRDGIAQNPSVYSYSALLGEVNLKNGRIPEAEAVLNNFLSLGDQITRSDRIKAKLTLSKLMLLANRPKEAGEMIDTIIEDDPKNVDAHYLKGQIYLSEGDGSGAITKFRSVINDHPDHINGYLGLSSAYALNKDYELALDVLKTALKESPDSTGILRAMVQMNLKVKDTKAAEENMKKIVSLDPYNLGSIAGLGDFYLSMNRYEDAIAQYRLLKDRKEGAPLGHFRTAQTLAKQNKMDKAIDEMTKGYEANKKSSVFITSLAQLYIKEGRFPEAIEKLNEAVRVDPKNRFAWFSLAAVYERVQDYDAAMEVYRDILKHHPESWMAANNLAYYLAELGNSEADFEEALALASKADKLTPDSPLVMDTLGWIHYKKGAFEKAESHLLKAQQEMPDNQSITYHLGAVYHSLGKREEAGGSLEKALAVNTPFLGRDHAVELYKTHYGKN